MGRIYTFSIAALLSICANSHCVAQGVVATEKIEARIAACQPPNPDTFKCSRAIERHQLAHYKQREKETITRTNNILKIPLAQRLLTLRDEVSKAPESTQQRYSYLTFIPRLNSHIIYVQEKDQQRHHRLIHHHSGQQTVTTGYPLPSPDGKYFMALSQDMFAESNLNNIEIWKINNSKFEKVATFEPDWGPHKATWMDADHIQVNKHCYAPTKENPFQLQACGTADIRLLDSQWILNE